VCVCVCVCVCVINQSGIPAAMQWQIERLINVLQNETVTMTRNKIRYGKPGQNIIVDLPYIGKVDSSSFQWFYEGSSRSTTHGL
jgi:hypothetical protein